MFLQLYPFIKADIVTSKILFGEMCLMYWPSTISKSFKYSIRYSPSIQSILMQAVFIDGYKTPCDKNLIISNL